ncbi:MAG: TerD family protein [Alphaproteobacteria bacterium]|nr:TerD family protein [Alphaproteobacteria bacterium]
MSDIFDSGFEDKKIELSDNLAVLGDNINITAKDPTLSKILIGAGWDLNTFDADALDLDISVFMLDKDGKTRVDEDFIFYNQPEDPDRAVRYNGDSRTGAGDGDDETMSINLQAVSFEIMKIIFVLSIYKGEEKLQNMGMVRNAYLRVTNAETTYEIVRYEMDNDLVDKTETAMIVASLNREGPKWHFEPIGEFIEGGLASLATRYGLIVIQQ